MRLYAINASSVMSSATNPVTANVPAAQSLPPVNVTITVTMPTAYKMRQAVDGFSFVAIGTVPLGTVCGNQFAQGYTVIPRAAVTMTSKFDVKPLIVFAQCS